MNNYVDLVLCETTSRKREVFLAPKWSHLESGDMVVTESETGNGMTNVVASMTVDTTDDEMVNFLEMALIFKFKELNRVKSRVVFRAFDYKED